jgi:hypothetical protein
VAAFQVHEGPPVLLLGGRGWRILDVEWRGRRVHVELSELKGKTGYRGVGRPLDRRRDQAGPTSVSAVTLKR